MKCDDDTRSGSTSSSNHNNNNVSSTNVNSCSISNLPETCEIDQDIENNNNNKDNLNNNEEETTALFSDETEKCINVCDSRSPSGSGSSGSGSSFARLKKRKRVQYFGSNFDLGQAILGNIDKGKRSVELAWRDVNYSVESTSWNPWKPCGVTDKKQILNGLTGSISTGDITAVIGPSGAGKSSFLEILAGRREKGFTGDLFVKFTSDTCHSLTESPGKNTLFTDAIITTTTTTTTTSGTAGATANKGAANGNGVNLFASTKSPSTSNSPPNDQMIKVAFMAQKDVFSPNLTVKETLVYASRLKNYSCQNLYHKQLKKLKQTDTDILAMSYKLKSEIDNFHYNLAAEIMEELSLLSCAHVRVGKCSGGQQKRLSIACELVSHPDILILDEPTSGLGKLNVIFFLSYSFYLFKRYLM